MNLQASKERELCAWAYRVAWLALICSLGHASLEVASRYLSIPAAVASAGQAAHGVEVAP